MQNPDSMPATRLDLVSAELANDPWPALRRLREQGAVVWHEDHQRWLVTTDQAVREVMLDFERFTVHGTVVEDLFGSDAFIAMDDRQRHNDLRGIWADAFRPRALKELRSAVTRMFDELFAPVAERLRDGEAVDVSDAICRPVPTIVIAMMMGVPKEVHGDIVRWSDAMAGAGAAYMDEKSRAAALRARDEAKESLASYLCELIELRRRRPADDLVGVMVKSDVAKEMSDAQLVQNLRQLLFAGNETTAKWLGHLFVTYAEHPQVRREITADRTLIPVANEEVMRWQGVVGTIPRRVRGGPIELAGVPLNDGDHITCLPGCANRDPARYDEPDRFDIHRTPQPHLGFGVGLHNCLGAALARMEVEIAMNGLLDQVPDFVLTGSVEYSSIPLRGPLGVTIVREGD